MLKICFYKILLSCSTNLSIMHVWFLVNYPIILPYCGLPRPRIIYFFSKRFYLWFTDTHLIICLSDLLIIYTSNKNDFFMPFSAPVCQFLDLCPPEEHDVHDTSATYMIMLLEVITICNCKPHTHSALTF
jgi:hypothetical protein